MDITKKKLEDSGFIFDKNEGYTLENSDELSENVDSTSVETFTETEQKLINKLVTAQVDAKGEKLDTETIFHTVQDLLLYNKYDIKLIEKAVNKNCANKRGNGEIEIANANAIKKVFNQFEIVRNILGNFAINVATSKRELKDEYILNVMKLGEKYLTAKGLKYFVNSFFRIAELNVDIKNENIRKLNKDKYLSIMENIEQYNVNNDNFIKKFDGKLDFKSIESNIDKHGLRSSIKTRIFNDFDTYQGVKIYGNEKQFRRIFKNEVIVAPNLRSLRNIRIANNSAKLNPTNKFFIKKLNKSLKDLKRQKKIGQIIINDLNKMQQDNLKRGIKYFRKKYIKKMRGDADKKLAKRLMLANKEVFDGKRSIDTIRS